MPSDVPREAQQPAINISSSYSSFREPTLAELLGDLWAAKWSVLVGALTGLLLAVLFMTVSVPHYRASMLVAPAERRTGPDIKALLPNNSSFAVQYMLNSLGSPETGDYVRFEHMLREPSVAAILAEDKQVMDGVQQDRRFTFLAPEALESGQELAVYLQDHVKVEPVGTSPLRRLVYDHPDRDFAAYTLARLHEVTDGIIRQEVRDRTASRADYLAKTLETVAHPDHRRALTSLLMEQEHVRMILAMDEPFAAIVAEPPSAGVKPQWPKRSIVFPVFAAVGMLLGFAAFNIRRAYK